MTPKQKQAETESLFNMKQLHPFGKDEQEFIVRSVIANQHQSAEIPIARGLWPGLTMSQLYNKIDQIKRGKDTKWYAGTKVGKPIKRTKSHYNAAVAALMAWKVAKDMDFNAYQDNVKKEAIDTMHQIMADPKAEPQHRVSAARTIAALIQKPQTVDALIIEGTAKREAFDKKLSAGVDAALAVLDEDEPKSDNG